VVYFVRHVVSQILIQKMVQHLHFHTGYFVMLYII
jgi:hypothetical protein